MKPEFIITSTGNPRVKEALRLRGRRGRAEGERILIDGVREISRAVDAGVGIEEVFYCDQLLTESPPTRENVANEQDARALLSRIESVGVRLTQVSESVFDKLRYGDRTGGLLAVARRPKTTLDDLVLSVDSLVAVVEGLEKPGNLGAILRTADAAGISLVIAVDPKTDIYGPNVIRASMGTVFGISLVESPVAACITWLREHAFRMVAASPVATQLYTQIDFTGRVAMVFGGEAEGLTNRWTSSEVQHARVPMLGRADSLNVATTAALFFYEARRQRGALE